MVNDPMDSGDSEARKLVESHFAALFGPTPRLEPVVSEGSFSGARIWKVTAGGVPFALRRWPALDENSRNRLQWSHRVLAQARTLGCPFLPVPIPDSNGKTLVEWEEKHWQIEPWMPGVALEQESGPASVHRAFEAMMKMHTAFATIEKSRGPSGSLKARLDRLGHWYLAGRFTTAFGQLESAKGQNSPYSDLAGRILNSFRRLAGTLEDSLLHSAGLTVDLQPVHGDLRYEHVLFGPELESVSGVVDFGAMKTDSIGLDIGRLAGGLFGSRADKWQEALRFMQETGPIGPTEWNLANVYYSTGTALAGMNWLQWACVEKRNMGSFDAIKLRMGKIATGMETLVLNL